MFVKSVPEVFFVGLRWPQHAKVSGYDAIVAHLGSPIELPIRDRWPWKDASDVRLQPRLRYWFTEKISLLLERWIKPTYSLPLLRMELAVARHMLFRRGAVYHVLYGETDVCLLGYLGRLTGNHVIASFHDGRDVLEGCGVSGRILRSLSAIVLLGECQKEFFLEHVDESKIHVVPHAVDTEFFTPDVSRAVRADASKEHPIVLTVGGHTRDHDTLAKVFDIVHQNVPSARFVAVSVNLGNKGTRLSGAKVEHLTGITDEELRDLYRRAAVAVFAFTYAVANNSILEALACGAPVVATNVGAVPEYVRPGAGLLAPVADADAMAEMVTRVIESERCADELARCARATAETFSLPNVRDALRDVYRNIDSPVKDIQERTLT